jgi:FtsH-binding integral membrane protein
MQPVYASSEGRPIPGAVATQGQNIRVEFLKKTYLHLAGAIFAFVGVCYGIMNSSIGEAYAQWFFGGGNANMLILLLAFMGAGWVANKFAFSQTSKGMQYLGLGIYVVAEAFITLPLLWVAQWVAMQKGMPVNELIGQAAIITLVLFGGLTATVLVTKKDFTFMGKFLSLAMWVAIGAVFAGLLFGFSLGLWFSVAMLALAGGYVLYYTSAVMKNFPPTYYVGAALALFSAIALMFFYVLRILIALQGRD